MKLKKTLLMLVLLLFLYGCEGNGTNDRDVRDTGAFVGGTDGLEIEFQENEPPMQIFDRGNDDFQITLLIENQGEFDIAPGDIVATLSGINPAAFDLPHTSFVNNLEILGKKRERDFIREGGREFFSFTEIRPASYIEDVSADFETTLRADVCYEYGTRSVAGICLKENTARTRSGDTCDINGDVVVENSAAPVQVDEVRQQGSGSNRIRLNIMVENKDTKDVEVFAPGTFVNMRECVERDELENKDGEVHVRVFFPALRILPSCSNLGGGNEGTIRLIDGKRTVTCTVETAGLPRVAFQDQLNVELRYAARSAVSKDITVLDSDISF